MRSRLLPAAILTLAFASPALAAIPEGDALKKFTSGGHVLGFDSNGYFTSNGTYALRVRFEGSAGSEPIASGAEQGTASPSEQAPALEKVSYKDIWPGVDLVYDAPDGGIARSTWTVAPGVDPGLIRLAYNRPVRLTERGDLQIGFETGTITESAPIAWQVVDGRREPVEVAFAAVTDGPVGFVVGEYREDLPLVIDPTLTWNSFLGGNGYDVANTIVIDSGGYVFVGGQSDAGWGAPVREHSGNVDRFAAKLNPAGNLLWHTFLGGPENDWGTKLTIDAEGGVLVAGHSYGVWGNPLRAFSNAPNAFAAKLDQSGNLAWSTFLAPSSGGSESDGIEVDPAGNIYFGGCSGDSWGNPIRAYSASRDRFAAKLNSDGELIWNTFLGGQGDDCGTDIAIDTNGNLYLLGNSSSSWGGPVRPHSGDTDAFTALLDSSGNLIWSTFLGGDDYDYGAGIAVDEGGNALITGHSNAHWGNPVRANAGGRDGFAVKLDSSGEILWHTFIGGTGSDIARAAEIDDGGFTYITGASGDGWQEAESTFSGSPDAFIVKLDTSGEQVWSIFLGGDEDQAGHDVALGANDSIFVAGGTRASWGSPISAYNGGGDAFVAKVAQQFCGNSTIDDGEQCDDGNTIDGDCCSSTCEIEPADTVCGPAADICDIEEVCDGTSSTCPADERLPDTDTDGTCDAYDICPDDPDPSQADTDEDGLGDACDPCTGGIEAYKPLLKATNFATAAGDDKLKYKAKLIFDDAVSISPQTQGFRLLVEDASGDVLIDLDIPAGLYDPIARSGWIPTPNGKKFQYITETPVDGMLYVPLKV